MAVKLNTEHLCLNTALCSRYMQTTVESDIIVPDIKPDIMKILQASCEVAIMRKEVQPDKVFIQGVVRMNLLYAPDNNVEGSIKSISSAQEFNHSMDIPGAAPGMELFAEGEAGPAEYTLVNSRKLRLRTRIALSARLLSRSEIDIATSADEGSNIQTNCRPMRLFNPSVNASRDILIRERIEVPEGKPAICEILRLSAKPYSTELNILDNRALAKGELKVYTLYSGEGDGTCPEIMEHTLPFCESLEIDGLREGMEGEIDYCLKDIFFEVCQDSDGDRRLVSIEAAIEAQVRGFEVIECSAVEDAFSPLYPIELKRSTCHIEQLLASNTARTTIKEPVSVPDYLPEVHRVCECTATPSIENVTIDTDEVTVAGHIQCNILYLSPDPSTPACGFAHILPFCQHFDVSGTTSASVCDAKAEVEHISCTISSDKCIEVRAIVATSIKVVEPSSVELVSEIICDEETPLPKMPSVSVYFVQKGDTLWSIAKKYRTTPDKILSVNQSAENLVPGKCIYIFR